MKEQPEALRLAELLETADLDVAAAELRRLHTENERLKKLLYDTLGELTALRAANQMRSRIDALRAEVEKE